MIAETTRRVNPTQLPLVDFIFGTTSEMQQVRATLETALQDDLPVLFEGESGTGKEMAARYLHLRSRRAGSPFVRVNCGAIPAKLLEGEMFGHDGEPRNDWRENAQDRSVGFAGSGTLFLDEVGEMELGLQQKIVWALENQRYVKDGNVPINPRIVCASSTDLHAACSLESASGGLSKLFGHRVRLLPLRERKQDIPQLCEYLSEKFANSFGRPVPRLSSYVLESFQQWNWPGNIRELENWIARIVIFGTEEAIGSEFRRQIGNREVAVPRRHRTVRKNGRDMRRERGQG